MFNERMEDDLIDLGAASAQTKGGHWGMMDQESSLKSIAGLTDD
jgi:hypothetical protein